MTSNEEYIKKNTVKIIDDDKNTRLHYAAALDNLDEVKKIVSRKQRMDPENYLGWTPLMMAVRNGNFEVIEVLLENGADATKKNKYEMNVFLISVTCGDIKTVEKILNHLLVGGVSRRSLQHVFSPISLAILFGQGLIFKYLLERSFDPNISTMQTGITPIMFAAATGNSKAIKKLLEHNADITHKNILGKTATDILQIRHQKIDIESTYCKQKPVPLIIISPQDLNSPHMQLAPFQTLQIPNATEPVRRSSNVQTPNFQPTPAVTPITPYLLPHVFFGSDFTPAQYIGVTPTPPVSYTMEQLLNANITPSTLPSPVFSLPVCHSNYV